MLIANVRTNEGNYTNQVNKKSVSSLHCLLVFLSSFLSSFSGVGMSYRRVLEMEVLSFCNKMTVIKSVSVTNNQLELFTCFTCLIWDPLLGEHEDCERLLLFCQHMHHCGSSVF